MAASALAAPQLVVRGPDGAVLAEGATLDFGILDTGATPSFPLKLSNEGDAPLAGLTLALEGPDALRFTLAPPTTAELEPAASTTADLAWVVRSVGKVSATLRIGSAAGNLSLKIAGEGTELASRMEITEAGTSDVLQSQSVVDWGSVTIGSAKKKLFRVKNISKAPLEIYGGWVDRYWGDWPYWSARPAVIMPEGFRVLADELRGRVLSPGESAEFEVQFSPYYNTSTVSPVVYLSARTVTQGYYSQSFRVKGTGAPYQPVPLVLNGLHYRMGEGLANHVVIGWTKSIPGSPIYGSVGSTSMGPVFRPYPLLNSWERWLGDSGGVYLQAVQGADNTWPWFGDLSGSSSTESVGSTSATTFAQGAHFTGAIKLAASDNVGLELWVRPDSLADGQCIAFVGNAGPDAGFGLYVQEGRLEGRVGSARLLSEPVLAGEWHHVSLILQNGQATLRVDGTVAGQPVPASLPDKVQGLGLGALSTGGDAFTGAVDELRLFEVAPGGFLPESHLLATAKPQSEISATALDFGNLFIGQTLYKEVKLINRGPGWLATDLEIVGADAADFTVTRQYPRPISQDFQGFYDWGFIYPIQLLSLPYYPSPHTDRSLPPDFLQTLSVQVKPGATGLRTATLRVTTNDPEHPVYEIALSAQVQPDRPVIVVSDKPVDFGRVLTNSQRYPSLGIDNTGTAPLEITLSVRGPHAEDFISPAAPVQINVPAGQRVYQSLAYQPQGLGGRRAVLHLTTNDPDRPEIDIPYFSEGEQPIADLQVMRLNAWSEVANNSVIDLGAVLMNGHESRVDLSVRNVGTDDLTGVKLSVEGEHAADFELTGTVPETLVRSGWWPSEVGVYVRFVPLADGPRTAVLRIESSDPDESPYRITLLGEGKPAAPQLQLSDGGNAVNSGQGFVRFGNAILGGKPNQRTHTLRVRNTGTAPLTSLRARFTGADASSFRAEVPQRIEVGAEGDIVLTFAPRRIGPQAAVLHVISSEAAFEQTLTVGGTGAHGLISSLRPTGSVPGWVGTALLELPNGHVLMAGHTTEAEVSTAWLRDIGPDGRETALAPRFHGTIRALALQSDGALIVVGNFTSVSTEGQSHLVQVGCARLQPDFQTVDTAFQPPAGEFQMRALVVLPDDKILLGGDGKIGGRAHLVRLNADGTLDQTFTLTAPDAAVQALALQPDGKVMVGGKFTNLEAPWQDLTDNLSVITLWPLGRRDGLCRLNVDGSFDTSFVNREFTEVTALAVREGVIAVGGIQEVAVFWAYITHGVAASNLSMTHQVNVAATTVNSDALAPSLIADQAIRPWPPNPSYWMQSQAALLRTDGTALLSQSCLNEPTAVALLPGHRLLLAPGAGGSYGYVDPHSPTVVLLRPNEQLMEAYGVQWQPAADTLQNYWYPGPTPVQSLDGAVNALLPMPDGKLLVAGAFAHAETKVIQGWNYQLTRPLPLLPELRLPDSASKTPVHGFAQLDLDGFFHSPPAAPVLDDGTIASDGLTTLEFQSRNTRQLSFGLPGDEALNLKMEIIGDHPEAFSVTREVVAPTRKEEAPTGSDDPVSVVLTFTGIPQGSTPLRAQFRMSKAVLAADSTLTYDDAGAFEIGLVTKGDAAIPAQLVIVDPLGTGELASGATVDFGTITEGNEEWRTLLLFNNGSAPITQPLTMILTGESATDFSLTEAPAYPIATNANTSFTLTFKPQPNGPALRTAMLSISDGSTAFPFVIQLQARVMSAPVVTLQPVDTLVFKNQPLTLTAEVASTGPVNWQWFKDGKRVPGARSATLTIPQASAEDAGRYFARVRSSAGNVTTETVRVGVVTEPPEQQLQRKPGDTLKLAIEATGPNLRFRWFTYDRDTRLPVMLSNNAHIAGASSAQLTLKKLHSGLSGPYACAITLGEATVTTPVTTLEVLPLPQLIKPLSATDLPLLVTVADQINADVAPVRFFARNLPLGLLLNETTGEITGAPRKPGRYRVGFWVVSAGGTSPVVEQVVTVRPLPAGLAGTYTGWLERNGNHNDGLGGQWSLAIATNGTFTARVRYGRSAPASAHRSDRLGKIETYNYIGTMQLMQEGNAWVAVGEIAAPDGVSGANFVARLENDHRHAQVTHVSATGITAGEADQTLKRLPARFARRYRGLFDEGGFIQPVTLVAGRDGNIAWTARLGTEAPFTVLSGSTQACNGMTTFWALAPDAEGGRSLAGSLFFDNAEPWLYLTVEWGRRPIWEDWSTSAIYGMAHLTP